MVVKSTNGGQSFSTPSQAAQLEDGLSDMPYSVIGRQTIWGHQIRWTSAGNISVNPSNPNDVTVVWSDRATPNPNATEECFFTSPGTRPIRPLRRGAELEHERVHVALGKRRSELDRSPGDQRRARP